MNDLRKAAEMALEALEEAASCVQNSYLPDSMGHDWDEQIDALRQALNVDAANMTQERVDETVKSKREWVGLTQEEVLGGYESEMEDKPFNKYTFAVIAGYIEAKLREKNSG